MGTQRSRALPFVLMLAAGVASCGAPPPAAAGLESTPGEDAIAEVTQRPSELERRVLGVYAHVNVTRAFGITEYEPLAEYLRSVDGVIGASPFVYYAMDLSAGSERTRPPAHVLVKGIDPATAGEVLDLDMHLDAGGSPAAKASSLTSTATTSPGDALPNVFIGVSLANELGVAVGEVVTLNHAATSGETGEARRFRIAGTFLAGIAEYDSRLIYVHIRELQAFKYGGKDIVSGIDLRLADPNDAPKVATVLRDTIGDYTILEWQTLNAELFATMRAQSTSG